MFSGSCIQGWVGMFEGCRHVVRQVVPQAPLSSVRSGCAKVVLISCPTGVAPVSRVVLGCAKVVLMLSDRWCPLAYVATSTLIIV